MSRSLQLSASTLRVRKALISSTLAALGHSGLATGKFASNVIKATALGQSKSKVKIPDWDILVLLSFLMTESFEPLEAVSFKDLTLKTCFLIMLASGRRASEVCNLSGLPGDVSHEADGSLSLNFLPEFLAKNQNPESCSPVIKIPPLSSIIGLDEPDIKNCPVRALRIYRKRSQRFRNPKQRALFLSCNKNYNNDIRVSTISRWMRALIIDAYLYWAGGGGGGSVSGILALRRPKTHEIRAWAASLASKTVPLQQVLKAAYWSSEDVFVNHYLRDVSRKRGDGLNGLPAVVAAQSAVPASTH